MAEIKVRGYVNAPKTKESTKGTFAVFTLAESQKQKDGSKKKVYYDCVDFTNPAPPESAFVTLSGWLSEKDYTKKDGTPGKGWSINVQSIEVSPARDGDKAPSGGGHGGGGGSAPADPFAI